MTTDVVPVLRVADAASAASWYERLGFAVHFEHRFGPDFPAYVGVRRDGAQLHLSEHEGDARPDTLIYLWVDDVAPVASEFDVEATEAPWAIEVDLTDPDGNRIRLGQALPAPDVARILGDEVEAVLIELERAMWDDATRWDRRWMDQHLADDFIEFGASGRSYGRDDILDQTAVSIEATLTEPTVRAIGRDAALVTYRSRQTRGGANRASVWRRVGGRWRLAFHQGTPSTE